MISTPSKGAEGSAAPARFANVGKRSIMVAMDGSTVRLGQERFAHASFKGLRFPPPQTPRTPLIPRAVVTGEDHKCILRDAAGLERIDDLPRTPVEFLDAIAI